MKRILLVSAVAGMLVCAGSAGASRNHLASVSVSPSPAHVGDTLEFTGCGYADGGVTIVISSPSHTEWFGADTSSGCIDIVGYQADVAGTYSINVYQSNDHHYDARLVFDVT